MNQMPNTHEDPRLAEILAIILKFAAGDLAARGTLAGDGSALDGVMAGINNLGESLEARESNLQLARELAERTAAEPELHSANEQLSVLLDSLPIAVYRCRADGDYAVQYMSQNVASFTGYTAGDFLAQADLWFSHIHPDDAPRVSAEMALLAEKGRQVYEYRWRKADGSYLWIRDSLRLISFKDGTPGYLVGMWQNITEDKLAAEALGKANDDLSLFRQLLDSSSDAIEVIDPTTLRYLDVNETACRALGYSREELLALSVHDIDFNSDTDTFRMIEEKMRKSGTARFETSHRRKDGSTFPVEVSMGAVTLDKLYGLGIVRDISERKQAAEALRQSEERFRALVESTSDWIWEVDRDGIYTYASPRVEMLLGYKPEEVLGRTPFDFMPPDEVQHAGKIFGEAIAKRSPLVALENTCLHKNGRLVVLQTSGVPFLGDNGEFAGYRGIDRDITDSKKAEEKIRKQQELTTKIIETIPLRVFWKDRDLRYLGCNTLFAKDAGLTRPEELIGKTDFEMSWKDQAEIYRADDQRVMDANTPKLSYDEPQTTPEGGQIWLRSSKVPLHNDMNETIGILGVYEDITAYKQAAQALEESERRFRAILDATVDGILVADAQTHALVTGNSAICEMLGYSMEELHGLRS